MVSDLLCNQGWTWTSDSPASISRVQGLHTCTAMPDLWNAWRWTQGFIHVRQALYRPSNISSPWSGMMMLLTRKFSNVFLHMKPTMHWGWRLQRENVIFIRSYWRSWSVWLQMLASITFEICYMSLCVILYPYSYFLQGSHQQRSPPTFSSYLNSGNQASSVWGRTTHTNWISSWREFISFTYLITY